MEKNKLINTRIFTKLISKTWILGGRDWVGEYIYYKNFGVALMYFIIIFNILNTDISNFWKHKTMFQPFFDIKVYPASIENLCDPRHLQGSHVKVGLLSYTVYVHHYLRFYFWMTDCLVISCFTSTWTIVGFNLGSKLKVCVLGGGV